MEAKELMIGNYVYHKGKPLQITNVIDFCVNMEFGKYSGERNNEIDIDEISPILLTPELLKKCGYEFVIEVASWANPLHLISQYEGDVWVFEPFCTIDKDCHITIKYLHQLQNLVFALTGEELKIEL